MEAVQNFTTILKQADALCIIR